MDKKNVLVIIDGSAIIHRAFHALPLFSAPDGTPTNALYGFIKMLMSLTTMLDPKYMAVCFDTPVKTFRKEMLVTYQAHRQLAPDELKIQIPLVQKFVQSAGIANFKKEGFEADDVIGTLTKKAQADKDISLIYIVTGDKDILQLVDERTHVVMPQKGVSKMEFVDEAGVVKKLGVPAKQVVDYKALVGDPSDNYPGVKGIGPKKCTDLLARYGTFENIYQHLDELDVKTRDLLTQYQADAELSKQLATILRDLDLEILTKDLVYKGMAPTHELMAFLDTYGLRSVKKQLLDQSKEKVVNVSSVDKTVDNQLSFF